MRGAILCALFVSAACGSSPTAPSSTVSTSASPSPSPPPTAPAAAAATSFRVTGVVTDETGTALSGLRLHFEFAAGDFASVPELPCNSYCTISTDATGGYELSFKALPSSFYGSPTVAGLIHTSRPGYQTNVQLLPLRADIVQHIRLRRSRVIQSGQSFTSVIESDSSMCTDMEDWFIWTHRCEQVEIAAQSTGTLVVDGREGTGGGALPYIFFQTTGNYTTVQNVGTGIVSVGVRAGEKYTVLVGAPVHMPPAQRYEVKTFIAEAP
jgi:hypothetical protein